MTHDPAVVRTAYHEAAHAAAAYVFGRPVSLVSIRPGAHFLGVTTWTPGRFPGEAPVDIPAIMWPAKARRAIETSIVVSLAGSLGAMLSGWPEEDGYRAPPDEDEAERSARVLAGLSERETATLAGLESATEPIPADDERARRLSWAIAGTSEAGLHLAYMRGVTRSLVYNPNFGRLLEALVPELLERGVLSGRRVREILSAAEGRLPPATQIAAEVTT